VFKLWKQERLIENFQIMCQQRREEYAMIQHGWLLWPISATEQERKNCFTTLLVILGCVALLILSANWSALEHAIAAWMLRSASEWETALRQVAQVSPHPHRASTPTPSVPQHELRRLLFIISSGILTPALPCLPCPTRRHSQTRPSVEHWWYVCCCSSAQGYKEACLVDMRQAHCVLSAVCPEGPWHGYCYQRGRAHVRGKLCSLCA
jgi:hypothetical protein